MIFILENNRTTGVSIRITLQRIEWKNRKIFWFNLHCHNKVHDSRPYGAHFSHNRSQLFRARFGRRIILHPLSNDVRSKLNKLKAVPSTQFEFCSFFIGYHSMKKHHSVGCWPLCYCRRWFMLFLFEPLRLYAFWLDPAWCLFHWLKTFRMIWNFLTSLLLPETRKKTIRSSNVCTFVRLSNFMRI